jgi:transposase-like protein
MLETEVETALEACRYARTPQRRGYRNGAKERKLHTSMGTVELQVPRARVLDEKGERREWQSGLLPRYERRTRSLDGTLVGMYLSGANLRRIQKALKPLLAEAPVSRSVVSRLVQRLRAHLERWRQRRFERHAYAYVYLDATNLRVRVLKKIRRVPVLAAMGVRQDGRKEMLGMELLLKENEVAWEELLGDLVRRGLNRPLLVIIDGHAGLRNAVETTWPQVPVQRCVVHKLRNLERHSPQEIYPEVKEDYHKITLADSLESAEKAYRRFVRKWKPRWAKVVTSLEEAGEEILTFYRFPMEQWKCLRSTNPIERINLEFKRRVKTQCSLPGPEAAVLLLFGLLLSDQIRFRRIDGWPKIEPLLEEQKANLRKTG